MIHKELQFALAVLVHEARRADYAEGGALRRRLLSLYEHHYVRKIAHLLYVPNAQSMLARNIAKVVTAGPGHTGRS